MDLFQVVCMTLAYKIMVNETRERKSGECEKMWNRETPPDLTDYRLDIIYCQISPLSQIMSHLEKKHVLFLNMTPTTCLTVVRYLMFHRRWG